VVWSTVEAWRLEYKDAPTNNVVAQRVLDAAQEVCESYAPSLADGATPPARYVEALHLQARETWQAHRRDNADTIGADGYVIRVRPLGGVVKQLLRPPRVLPGVC